MRQSRCHGAERGELFPLQRVAFQVAHLVRGAIKYLPGDRTAGAQHLPEILLADPEQFGWFSHPSRRHPRNVKQKRDFPRVFTRFYHAHQDRLTVVSPREANFAFEDHVEKRRPLTFGNQNSSAGHVDNFTRLNAVELRAIQLREERDGTDLLQSVRIRNHKRPRYS